MPQRKKMKMYLKDYFMFMGRTSSSGTYGGKTPKYLNSYFLSLQTGRDS